MFPQALPPGAGKSQDSAVTLGALIFSGAEVYYQFQ
jgi:hypothetical protein